MSDDVKSLPTIAGVQLRNAGDNDTTKPRPIGHLIWGPSGSGKTTLASTYPGKKLWITYDAGAIDCLGMRDDIIEVPLYAADPSHVERWKDNNPFGIAKLIKEHEISTIVFDSLTSLSDVALQHGVAHAAASPAHARAGVTLEDPGFGGYGRRKTWVMLAVHNMVRIAYAHGCNIVFLTHEDSPVTDAKGAVLYITMTLGSDMPDKTALAVTEVWHMQDLGKDGRRITVRSTALRKPMKSRIFDATDASFMWNYDDVTKKGWTMAKMLDDWRKGGYAKLPLPR